MKKNIWWLFSLLSLVTVCFFSLETTVHGSVQEDTEVAIIFKNDKKLLDNPKLPKDDTPTSKNGKVIHHSLRLPQTGEVVKQLTIFIGSFFIVLLGIAFIYNNQKI